MSAVTVLVVPNPDLTEALLADGACGARVPTARQFVCDVLVHGESRWCPACRWERVPCHTIIAKSALQVEDRCFRHTSHRDALVLTWEGIDLHAGWDCFRHFLHARKARDMLVELDPVGGLILTSHTLPKQHGEGPRWYWFLEDWNGSRIDILHQSTHGPHDRLGMLREVCAEYELGTVVTFGDTP